MTWPFTESGTVYLNCLYSYLLNVFKEFLNANLFSVEFINRQNFPAVKLIVTAADNCFKWAEMLLAALLWNLMDGAKKSQVEVVILELAWEQTPLFSTDGVKRAAQDNINQH